LITHILSNLVIGRAYQTHIFHETQNPLNNNLDFETKPSTFLICTTFSKCYSLYKGDRLFKYIFIKISGENNLKQVNELFKTMLTYKKEESHFWSIITHKKGGKQVNYVNVYFLRSGNPIVRVLFWAHKNELDIHFFLDILIHHTFSIQLSDWLSLPNTYIS